ncbi:MAG: hypothetical protein ACRDCC_08630 [Culicoidibacterales bacterium]
MSKNNIDKRKLYHSIMNRNCKQKQNMCDPICRLQEFGMTVIDCKSYKKMKAEIHAVFPNILIRNPVNDYKANYIIADVITNKGGKL